MAGCLGFVPSRHLSGWDWRNPGRIQPKARDSSWASPAAPPRRGRPRRRARRGACGVWRRRPRGRPSAARHPVKRDEVRSSLVCAGFGGGDVGSWTFTPTFLARVGGTCQVLRVVECLRLLVSCSDTSKPRGVTDFYADFSGSKTLESRGGVFRFDGSVVPWFMENTPGNHAHTHLELGCCPTPV